MTSNLKGVITKTDCIFCFNKGIPPPHNHTIRDFTKKGSPICCPQLLANVCSFCNLKGHTHNYCKLFKANKPKEFNKIKKQSEKQSEYSLKKRSYNPNSRDMSMISSEKKQQKIGLFVAEFGAMEISNESG